MKMLGNDVLTQEEFDEHMNKTFKPTIDGLKDDVKKLKIAVAVSAAVALVALLMHLF